MASMASRSLSFALAGAVLVNGAGGCGTFIGLVVGGSSPTTEPLPQRPEDDSAAYMAAVNKKIIVRNRDDTTVDGDLEWFSRTELRLRRGKEVSLVPVSQVDSVSVVTGSHVAQGFFVGLLIDVAAF